MKLLFIHGAGGGADLWRYQTAFFPGSVAVDLPGHPQGEGFQSIEDYASWIRGYISAREMAPVVLVGHSMGGAIAQLLAVQHPEIVRALVLTSTGARLRVAPQIFQALEGNYEKAVDFMLANAFGPTASPELLHEVKRLRLKVLAQTVKDDFVACDKFDIMDQVGAISVPTLIICGTEDRLTPPKYSQFLNSRIPGSQMELIPDGGHSVMLEKPEEFNHAIKRFLTQLEAEDHATQ